MGSRVFAVAIPCALVVAVYVWPPGRSETERPPSGFLVDHVVSFAARRVGPKTAYRGILKASRVRTRSADGVTAPTPDLVRVPARGCPSVSPAGAAALATSVGDSDRGTVPAQSTRSL